MDLKGLAALLSLAVLTVEAAPGMETCPCPGDGCVCRDQESCSGEVAVWESCSSPGQVCCRGEARTRRQTDNDAFLDQCGVATPSSDLPWAVSIYTWLLESNDDYYRLCPGVLIHPQVVLSSAYCTPQLADDDELLVYAGERGGSPQARLVTKLAYHDYYDESTLKFDIALLYTDAPFMLGDAVRVLCLPQRDKPLDMGRCFSTRLDEDSGKLEKTGMELKAEVDDCVDMLPGEAKKQYHFPDYSSFCAVSRDAKSLCDSDEGGSLVCPLASDPDRVALGGVVSLALGCSDASRPIFYTNTTYFAAWIQVRLALVGLDNFAIPP